MRTIKKNKMKKMMALLILILATVLLSACSGKEKKPEDVSQDFWDMVIQGIIHVDKATQEKELFETELFVLPKKEIESFSEKEKSIYKEFLQLCMHALEQYLEVFNGISNEWDMSLYDNQYSALESTFGKSNLKHSNYDEELLRELLADIQLKNSESHREKKDNFLHDNDVNLTGKEVQFDMVNNLDKEFFLEGKIELCDYYNYGFTNEESFFCGKLTPLGGSYMDSWYLYFHRDSFGELYDLLIDGATGNLMVVAKVPSSAYKKNQGNMAAVKSLQGY